MSFSRPSAFRFGRPLTPALSPEGRGSKDYAALPALKVRR